MEQIRPEVSSRWGSIDNFLAWCGKEKANHDKFMWHTYGVSPRHCVPRGGRLIVSLSLIPLPDEGVIALALGDHFPVCVYEGVLHRFASISPTNFSAL